MATLVIIDDPRTVPPPTTAAGKLLFRMREYEGYIMALGDGAAGRLVPDKEETAHGLGLRVVRAAKRVHMKVETWEVDGVLFFTVTATPQTRQPRTKGKYTRKKKAATSIGV